MSVFRRVQQAWVQVVPFRQTRALQTVVSRTKIQSLLDSKKYSYKLGQSSFVLQCPFCKRGDGASSSSTPGSMFVNYNTGGVVCKPCAVRGTWSNFLEWSTEGKSPTAPVSCDADSAVVDGVTTATKVPTEHAQKVWSGTRKWEESSTETTDRLRKMFGIEVLTNPALEKYQVHTATSASSSLLSDSALPCVAFPWYHGKDLVKVRLETIPPTEELQSSGEGVWGVFGWGTVEPASREIVIAGGELDAIAIHQSTGLPAVVLPSDITKLPSKFLSEFDQFKKINLWLGSSGPAKHTATHLANQLGLKRCYLVSSQERGRPLPTALGALSKEGDLAAIISRSKRFAHDQIFSFNQLRGDVYGEFSNREMVAGVKWRRFPQLTSSLKGHRSGELTVLTGPTGRGKTTLLAEMSLDLCLQGVSTLWGSFEIKNVRLAKTLLKQYSGVDIERHLHDYDSWADKFQHLPLYFMGFYGSADISTVIETMSHAVYAHNIQHVIVDNLQFMLGSTNILDTYSAQNQAIGALRRFASAEDVHVTVVIHPRKEDDNNPLTTASIFGTAKAAQEADNVIILQCPHGKDKYIQVTKNRFDGDLGMVPLSWDKESCTMSGHFNRPPPQTVADNKTITASPELPPSPHPQTVKKPAFGVYRPQGSKLIGRVQSTSGKSTNSGSPLINQPGRVQSTPLKGTNSGSSLINQPGRVQSTPLKGTNSGSPLINQLGRLQSTPLKGTNSGSPLINQASPASHDPSRRTV